MKMAVVGCEASGKTVFMSALADYYGRDAANNPMRLKLTPENAAANKFERLMFRQMRCQRQWPPATPPNSTVEIQWALRKDGESVATIDLLEFGGETFRAAFRDGADKEQREGSVAELLKYLGDADFFVVLVSIKALLADPNVASMDEFDRETEALWVTRGILDFIRTNRPNAAVVIGLTQADRYRNELGEAGGPKCFFAERWPSVAATIGKIPVVDVASVSKTDAEGNPAEGYRTLGILPVMRIFAQHCFGSEDALETGQIGVRPAGADSESPSADEPPLGNPFSAAPRAGASEAHAASAVGGRRSALTVFAFVVGLAVVLGAVLYNARSRVDRPEAPRQPLVVAVTNTVETVVEKRVEIPVTNTVEKIRENRVEVQVTNTVEKVVENRVEVPVTNTVEKVVEKVVENRVEVPVTNTVEKVVEKVVEKRVEVPVTNTVEKIVQVEKVITNVVEKVVRPGLALTNLPATVTMAATNFPPLTEAELKKQVPAGYRIWTDYNGRKIIAKWTGIAVDNSGITIVSRYNRRIDAVLWKFSPEDQDYIRSEIKRHTDEGEIMHNGEWIRNPMLKGKAGGKARRTP